MKKILQSINTRIGIIWFSVFFIWAKTIFAYFFEFQHLHNVNPADYLIMLVNPIGFTAFFICMTLFIKRTPLFYLGLALWNFVGNLLVYGNVLYYREFSDFLSINTITGGAGMVGHGFDLA